MPSESTTLVPRGLLSREEASRLELFQDVALEGVWHLLADCPVREVVTGEVLIRPGDIDHQLFLVLQGELNVHVGAADEAPIAVIGAGGAVGELAALDRLARSAAVIARAPSRVLVVSEERFWSLLTASHELALNLIAMLAARLRGNTATIAEIRHLQRHYQRNASYDALTDLHNRRWVDEVVPRILRRQAQQGAPLSLVVVDIDHFKRFNDDFGHAAGDLVLAAVARVMQSRLRPSDTVARHGGEEFLFVLPDTPAAGALVAADRVRRAIAALALDLPDGRRLPTVSASMGIAEVAAGEELASLLSRADAALYAAKRAGRDRCELAADAG